ncbi:MAG: nitroimidazol reductase NimA-like FMN-containing flavoprotein [Candidatus Poriferisodalaceae bacterium]|jgi:nitroimidazol reductase NimA-like FMN-containing flavoprotein (pyridoxamine 5'-phosphate oxidase superfamily)
MADLDAPSDRTKLKRGKDRAHYLPDDVRGVLEAGVVAHVGVNTERGVIVLPMAYGTRGDEILIHGGVANAMLRAGAAVDVCITITIIDGLVVARSPLHNSMNYRSVVIRGEATRITESADHVAALKVINDHTAPIWDTAREPNEAEYKQTMVLSVPLTEASAKIRPGDPIDDAEDVAGPHWAGVVPIHTTWGDPIPSQDLRPGIEAPAAVTAMANTNVHPGA